MNSISAKFSSLARLVLLAVLVGTSFDASAFPLTTRRRNFNLNTLRFAFEPGFRFPGIVALSNCSASLVRFKNAKETDKALVLTNGHCVGGTGNNDFLMPGEVLSNFPREFKFNLLNQRAETLATLTSSKIVYATMTATDLAILEVNATYKEIFQKTQTAPLVLSDRLPAMGTEIHVASGYWKRTYACSLEALIPTLKEGDWTFRQSIRYSPTGCEIIGGTSGSPVINVKTAEVIAINNTTNEDGLNCLLNNPCEIDEKGNQQVVKGRGYAQQTFVLYSCLTNTANGIDLTKRGCLLPKPVAQQFRFRR